MLNLKALKFLKNSKLWRNTHGNFATMGAIVLPVLMLFSGLTIDFIRVSQAEAELQSIVDAAVVAASADPELSESEREDIFKNVIEEFVAANNNLANPEVDLTTDVSLLNLSVTATSNVEVPLFFKGVVGGGDKVISASARTITDSRTVEIALVLDISTSMNDSRLNEMKAAASNFIETLLDGPEAERIHISMVPYGGAVRLPQSMFFLLDPPEEEEEVYWPGGMWNGCLFMLPDDYQNGINIAANFPYLPSFWTFGGNSHRENNPWCPRVGNEVVGLTQDKEILLDTINNFSRSDGTVTGIAAAWGLTTLEPSWRGVYPNSEEEVPFDFEANRRKIMILMSDGGSSHLLYPNSNDFDEELPFLVPNNSNRRERSQGEQNNAQQSTCAHIRSRGVEIYTVGFQLRNNNQRANLANCASSVGTAFDSQAGGLDDSFDVIAGQVSGTRLSQ